MPKVNYLVCACSYRACRDINGFPPGKEVLRLHLEQLLTTDLTALAQITIVRPLPLDRCPGAMDYWTLAAPVIEKLRAILPVEELDVQDMWWSYTAWTQAIQLYNSAFDYYILMEDDFYPAHPDFVNILIRKHTELLPDGGYLGSFCHIKHMALSNGICDSKTILEGLTKYLNPLDQLCGGPQVYFSQKFFGEKLADYTDEFRCLTFVGDVRELDHSLNLNNTIDLINPIQFLCTGLNHK
jgi:hypothetical protein